MPPAAAALRRAQMQTAIYRHDIRHHLSIPDGYLTAGKPEQALRYIRSVESDIAAQQGHGFGCRSIRAIVQQHHGLYTFSPEQGIFTLQIVLPLPPS